jgi:ParB-like chromosome segregation protein Spo0J
MTIRSRIVGHQDVAPDQLLANPLNFRRHPGKQKAALEGSLKDLGWLKEVIVNTTTGHVLDGHARVEEALAKGEQTIPVTYVEISEAEERKALAVLDPITEMATRDEELLASLLADVETSDPGLQALLDDLAGKESEKKGPAEGSVAVKEQFSILITCANEAQQAQLLERFTAEGLECRALIR